MSLKIGLFTSLRVNVGDEFIREGIRAILDRIGLPYYPLYVNKVDQTSLFHHEEDEVITVPDKYWDSDIFIQAGAPVYWYLGEGRFTSITSDWYQWAWQDRFLNKSKHDHPIFVNLGAGSCQPWGENGHKFIQDPECVNYANRVAERSALTTVRDPIASEILNSLSIPHLDLPCPAFLAAERHQPSRPCDNVIGVNLMPLGSHHDLLGNFDKEQWLIFCVKTINLLRRMSSIVFICHDLQEKEFISSFAASNDVVFYSPSWRDYLDIYSNCHMVLANRVHGAVCASGFGVPSIILGNDTRTQIGDYIGLTGYQSGKITPHEVFEAMKTLKSKRDDESKRLITKRKESLEQYLNALNPVIARVSASQRTKSTNNNDIVPKSSLASVRELESPAYQAFMTMMNRFAEKRGLRQFINWSKIWEYPWIWFNGLLKINWVGLKLLDIGSEISPMPWFLASLGADVTMIERDDQWVRHWEQCLKDSNLDVKWRIVTEEILPFRDASFDIVTSFSVIEHQVDKERAIDEVARLLKPKGIFALSFDICEKEMGMSFPVWNGSALTLRDFERIIWDNTKFDNGGQKLAWNLKDIPDFIKWHMNSATHHNYVTGAAILTRLT